MQLTPEEILALVKAIPTKEAKAARRQLSLSSSSALELPAPPLLASWRM